MMPSFGSTKAVKKNTSVSGVFRATSVHTVATTRSAATGETRMPASRMPIGSPNSVVAPVSSRVIHMPCSHSGQFSSSACISPSSDRRVREEDLPHPAPWIDQ